MIIFRKLRWKNLLSTGNTFTELCLDKSPTTLVLGANGSGKSTMLDALCYGLFKKPFRKIKKDQIYNTINDGDCVVEVEFEIGTHTFKVSRGIKPDFFKIYEDGATEPRHAAAGQKDDQAYLEEDVLKVGFDNFIQVVILGNAKYVPFMQLDAKQRRSFIEFILDIGVFSTMNEVLGNRQKGLKTVLEALSKDINTNEEKLKLVEGFITKLETERKNVTADTQRQIDEQNQIIDDFLPEIEALQKQLSDENDSLIAATEALNEKATTQIDALQESHDLAVEELEGKIVDYSQVNNKLVGLSPVRNTLQQNLKANQSTIDFYSKNDSCNTCKQQIHTDFKDGIIAEKKSKIAEIEVGLAKLDETCAKYQQVIADSKKTNTDIQLQINKLTSAHQAATRAIMSETQSEIKLVTASLQATIRKLQADLQAKQGSVTSARSLVKKMQADIKAAAASSNIEEQHQKRAAFVATSKRLEGEKNEAIETRHFYEVAAVLLKDTGIKAAIIKQYLSTINKLVNKYLSEMDFFLSFHLDENFGETFKSRHRDTLQYYSFSEGEKMRIDLALLFTWRDIAHMKNSCSTNLLILDEVIDSSLDHNGTDFFIRMLNQLGQSSQGSNVFVISHKNDAALDKFQDVIRFEKVKNFSHLIDDV